MSRTKKQKRSKEEVQAYYAELRQQWAEAKAKSQEAPVIAIYEELRKMGLKDISLYNVSLVYWQATAVGFDGLPYIDFKTYNAWRDSGFQVEKGQKSQVLSITWVGPERDEADSDGSEEENKPRWPKATHLFHRSQVKPILEIEMEAV